MTFEWDAAKNAANLLKHGIDFADVVRIFDGAIWERIDDRRSYGETRMITIGVVDGREFAVIYTTRGSSRRIISARRANSRERKAYREAFGQ